MNQFLLIGVVAIAVLAIALEAEPRKPHLIPSRNGRVRPWKFHGFRSSMSSDNVNSQSGPVPFNCDSCKEEVTKILAADCDNLDNEPAKDLCEKLDSEHPVVVSIKSTLEPESMCTAFGICQVEQSEDVEGEGRIC